MENKIPDLGFKGARMIVLPTEAFEAYVAHPLVARLYLTDVGYFPRAKNHTKTRREGIEEYILLYCVAGSGQIRLRGRTYRLEKNQAFCIPRGVPHRYDASDRDPWTLLWVHFKGTDTAYYPLDECRVVTPPSGEGNRMMFLFELLFGALDGDYSLDNFIYISQVLSLILSELYRRGAPADKGYNRHLTRAVRYMYDHLAEPLTLEQLAGELDLSKSYLNAVFQRYAHRSPLQFFVQLRMTEACKLLKETELSVHEIARRLGYDDPYYFSRVFRKAVGVPPTAYRAGGYIYEGGTPPR